MSDVGRVYTKIGKKYVVKDTTERYAEKLTSRQIFLNISL